LPGEDQAHQEDLGFGRAGRDVASITGDVASAAPDRMLADRDLAAAAPDPVSTTRDVGSAGRDVAPLTGDPAGGIAPRTFARATRSGASRYVSACTNSSGTVCRPDVSTGAGDMGCVTVGSSTAAARIGAGIGAETTADAGRTTAAEARIAARSGRRGLITRAARLNTLRVAVS
jgi:hypothetical protein